MKPEALFISHGHSDHADILKPQVYDINDKAWADPRKQNTRAMHELCN